MSQLYPEGRLQQIVGANLRRHRERLGLSQEEFAEVCHVHRTYMGGLERGERNITLVSLERIAHWCGLDPMVLLTA